MFDSATSKLPTLHPLSGAATPGERYLNGTQKGTVPDSWAARDQPASKSASYQFRLPAARLGVRGYFILLQLFFTLLCSLLTPGYFNVLHG